jgi:MFS family permease
MLAASPAGSDPAPVDDPRGRWVQLAVLATGTLLALSPWFSAAAVGPMLAREWGLTGLQLPLMTVLVQLGFALAALASAVAGIADVVPGRWLLSAGAVAAGAANLGFALVAHDPGTALLFRAATGAALAFVYPVGMKLIAGWFRRDRGLAVGVLIGSLTVGSASPHLFRAFGAFAGADWRPVVAAASLAAFAGGLLVLVFARPGPLEAAAPRFSLRLAAAAFRSPAVRLANLGYLGHMWELYAMWTWVPAFLAASLAAAGLADRATASLAAFAVVATGGIGCVVAGFAADRLGRTATTIAAMTGSGVSAVAIGLLFGGPPIAIVGLALFWGLTVVADSAQFSTAVTELAPPGTAGSALSLQVAAGFLLTGVTILGVGALGPSDGSGWTLAFVGLAIGPAAGIAAMARLRGRPEASAMAGGHR